MSESSPPLFTDDEEYNIFLDKHIETAREDFYAYLTLMNPRDTSSIVFSEVHLHLVALIEGVYDGTRAKRQAISMPPQHGKSRMLSFEAVTWIMGRDPTLHIAIASFSHELVTNFSLMIKERITHPLYQKIFPNTQVSDVPNRLDYWNTTAGGRLMAKSVGKKLTGNRVDWLIIDDAHAGREEADSKLQREKVVKWCMGDCLTRLAPNASVFLIGTRFHPEDLIGTLTSDKAIEMLEEHDADEEIFEVTNFPAICENEEGDRLGRSAGEALFPEVRDIQFLNTRKATYAAQGTLYEWDSQFQGEPKVTGGGVADVGAIPIIGMDEVPEGLEAVRGYDLAVSEKQIADYTASAKLSLDPKTGNLYIINVKRNKLAWPKNEKLIVDLAREELIRIRIEAVAGFLACYQTVREKLKGEVIVTKSTPKTDKLVRANRWLPKAEAGKLFLVRGKWNQEFKDELESFPVGEHDDMVDAVSIAFEMVNHLVVQQQKKEEGRTRPSGRRRPQQTTQGDAPPTPKRRRGNRRRSRVMGGF